MRNYIVSSWNDADQYNYSGEQIGNRQSKSQRVHFNPDGSACVASYGDDEPKVSKVSIKDKILPQFKRLSTLRTQMVDLEQEYKTTNMSIEEYSLLRNVIVCKIARAEELYKKAVSVKPTQPDEDDIDLYTGLPDDTAQVQGVFYATNHVSAQRESDIGKAVGVVWIDDLPHTNSFKSFLQISCKVVRKAVHYKYKVKAYYQTLKEV